MQESYQYVGKNSYKFEEHDHNRVMYELELNETIGVEEGMAYTRVPGGWIYRFYKSLENSDSYHDSRVIFIPFNNEFKIKKRKPSVKK